MRSDCCNGTDIARRNFIASLATVIAVPCEDSDSLDRRSAMRLLKRLHSRRSLPKRLIQPKLPYHRRFRRYRYRYGELSYTIFYG